MKGFELVSSLAPIVKRFALVLNISAGKAIKLPKGHNDKTFEKILDDVEIGAIPTKFILELHIKLNNGQTIKVGQEFLKRVKTTESIFEGTELKQFEDQVVDIKCE